MIITGSTGRGVIGTHTEVTTGDEDLRLQVQEPRTMVEVWARGRGVMRGGMVCRLAVDPFEVLNILG